MTKCNLCPAKCNIDRTVSIGRCRCHSDMKICRIAPHYYEEPEISGKNGSGTIFFSGCSMNCEFCQNHEISKKYVGKTFTPAMLADAMKELEDQGVHNINLVTPTHFSDKIREALDIYRPNIPIVYNTSGYERPEIIKEMNGYVDIYLTDFKYASDDIAFRYSKVNNYYQNCFEATKIMVEAKPLCYGQDGMMKSGVIIRHLVLPTQLNNTFSFIDLYKQNFYPAAKLSVMAQFFPAYHSTIDRPLKPVEYKLVINYLLKNGIDDCNIQELSSADKSFVPPFTLS